MGIFSRFENKMEDTFEGAADRFFDSPISPVQIAKKAAKQMKRQKMVGAGKQYAPTLYTVLVNAADDDRLFGYYPTLAGETETFLKATALNDGLVMDGQPLVRFIVDEGLKSGKFEVVAELVAAPIVKELRAEEMERYGIKPRSNPQARGQQGRQGFQGARNEHAVNTNNFDNPYDGARYDSYNGYDNDYSDSYNNGYDSYSDGRANNYANNYPGGYANNYPDGYAEDYADNYADDYADDHANNYANDYSDNYANSYDAVPQTVMFNGGAVAAAAAEQAAPTKPTRARLIDRTNKRTYTLAGTRSIIGRETTCNIVVNDANASRKHAELRLRQDGGWDLIDLHSTNGTYLNGRAVEKASLAEGDRLTIGTTSLIFTEN